MNIPAVAIYLERREPINSMARFYSMSLELDLFDSIILRRRWGRRG
ncbi:WGR domain-containing protein (plasmid) [Rhizobium sp. TH2]|nr:WGR domain-containing protein [Rhizobium sp. TH2]